MMPAWIRTLRDRWPECEPTEARVAIPRHGRDALKYFICRPKQGRFRLRSKEFRLSQLPVVSIIGRPNVGKSSLFNRILRKKIAVVDDVAGVTRDRNYMQATWNGADFMLVDTGGLIPGSRENIPALISRQVDIALAESAVIIFLADAATGPTDLDAMIARRIRKEFSEKIILAVNKAEKESSKLQAGEYMALGCGEPLTVSALHGLGVADLLDAVCERLQGLPPRQERPATTELRLVVVGRPNVGKSSFVNSLLNQNRMIVDAVAGTTRDAVDSFFEHNGAQVRIIDTAGLRRKAQVKENLEYYTNVHALSSIERCDVAVLMADAGLGVSEQDLKIVSQILELRKGIVVCLNKWDLVAKDHTTFDHLVKELKSRYMELRHVPVTTISALTGQRVRGVIDIALLVKQRLAFRFKPAEFKESLFGWTRVHPHPVTQNKQVRILGGKQRAAAYPLFEFYCSHHTLVLPSYQRYLINKIYEVGDLEGCPVVCVFKAVSLGRGRRPPKRGGPPHKEEQA
jgi:GTP-binding protein